MVPFQVDVGYMTLRLGYRVRQFWVALTCSSTPVEESVLRAHLNSAQIELFRRMTAAEQRHALEVMRTLQERQRTGAPGRLGSELALFQAALLHDVGKAGGRIRLWHRVATVLLQRLWPAGLHWVAFGRVCRCLALDSRSWRYPFFVLQQHAERGAQLAAQAGADPLAVALIRAHHAKPEAGIRKMPNSTGLDADGQALLAALQAADEEN